jgi:hypothetical protein
VGINSEISFSMFLRRAVATFATSGCAVRRSRRSSSAQPFKAPEKIKSGEVELQHATPRRLFGRLGRMKNGGRVEPDIAGRR